MRAIARWITARAAGDGTQLAGMIFLLMVYEQVVWSGWYSAG